MHENKKTIQINNKLYEEIKNFCTLNELKIGKYVEELLQDAFMKDKYGEAPFFLQNNLDNNEKISNFAEIDEKTDEKEKKVVKAQAKEEEPAQTTSVIEEIDTKEVETQKEKEEIPDVTVEKAPVRKVRRRILK